MKRSFTLVELLVVTVIMGIILGVTVPAFSRLMTGNAVSYGLRMTTSQLNMARTEACARRRYVAVVFLDKNCDDANAYLPKPEDTGENIGFQRAFRSCYVTKNGSNYEFEEWVKGTKWEFLPKGAYFSTLSNLLTVKDVKDEDGLFKDNSGHDVSAVVFTATGKPAEKSSYAVEVREGVVTDNNTVTRNTNADNKLTAKINRYTGSVRTE